MNLDVTSRAVGILRILVMLRTRRFNRSDVMRDAMASQTKLTGSAEPEQPRISRTVRRVTGGTSFSLQRRVFVGEWSLLISVALNASRIRARSEPRLFKLEAAMRVVTIAALHRPFENFVMEGRIKRRLHFTMAPQTKLRLANLQHVQSRKVRLLRVSSRLERDRARQIQSGRLAVW